jgi:gamma-glutamyltranspeptidase / glutathione hydrolase
MRPVAIISVLLFLCAGCVASPDQSGQLDTAREVDLSPETWQEAYDAFAAQLSVVPTETPVATGHQGAVAIGHFGLAAQAGLEALQRGGTAVDAALTTALTQIALDGGKAITYFGVLALVYYDAGTGTVHTMNADWNSVLGESDPLSIPGGPPMADGRLTDIEPSGRTALVGGFMKGVEAAHDRFGRLPFAQLFEPAIYVAREGVPVSADLAQVMELRASDLARLPETAATFLKPGGQPYQEGEVFRQPALAQTLAAVASQGSDYMYKGAWGERLVAAVQADGGYMTMEDLANYEVIWDEPLSAPLGEYVVHTMPPPMLGGVLMIEAQNLAVASGLIGEPHWSEDASSLRKALTIAQATMMFDFMSEERFAELYPGLERTDSARLTPGWAEALWARMETGTLPMHWQEQAPSYSDVIVVADAQGNLAALGHSIHAVHWGKTAIVVDGVTISDAGSFLQGILAGVEPGARVPGPSQVGILTRDGEAVLGFASKGSGMHHRPFQGLLSFVHHGMPVGAAVAAPDFFLAMRDADTGALTMQVPEGRFPQRVLDGTGWAYQEIPLPEVQARGEGVWVAVSRDPETGQLTAASHTRSNSAAVAY